MQYPVYRFSYQETLLQLPELGPPEAVRRITAHKVFMDTGWAEIVENFRTGEFFSCTYCRFYDF
eukprot:SAG11_NODE_2166_length_3726_cov_6.269369_5_plen_64_part_00